MMNSAWHFLNPTGGLDPILRGLVGPKAKLNTQEHMMHDELRERLFKFSSELALDLAALSLQRGRDHGLPRTRLLMCYLSPSYHGQHFPTLPLFRLQWMEEVLRAVTLPSNGVSCSNAQHSCGREAFGPLQDTWQDRCLAGRSSWAVRPWRKSGTLVCLLDFYPVPKDSPRRPVLHMIKKIFFVGQE